MSDVINLVKKLQRNEITEHKVYLNIANSVKKPEEKKIIEEIAAKELEHYHFWQVITETTISENKMLVWWYSLLAKVLGYTFVLKKMENNEVHSQKNYLAIAKIYPEAEKLAFEEQEHEKQLIELLDEEKLKYVGSMVLGLNDALVELTGTIAGLSFALQNTKLVALSGIVTGISATLSMMSSEYLAKRSGDSDSNPIKASIYTGIMYIVAVILMVTPYVLLPESQYALALVLMLVLVVLMILIFTYYISVAQGLPFKKRFTEMFVISMSVALLAFIIGVVVKQVLGIDI